METTKFKITQLLRHFLLFALIILLSGCGQKTSNALPGNETEGEFTYRMTLAKERMTGNKYKPVFTPEFILADVNINTEDPRRFYNYSGDLSGRYIEVMATYLKHETNSFLDTLVKHELLYQRADGRFGDPSLVFTEDSINKNHMPLLWGNGRLLVGLLEYYSQTGDKAVLEASRKLGDFFLATYKEVTPKVSKRLEGLGADGIICFTQYVEPLVSLSKITGDSKYAEAAAKVYPTLPPRGTLHTHGYQTTLRGILDLYEYDKNPVHFDYVKKAYDELVNSADYTIYGSVKEYFGGRGNRDEGCSTADFIRLSLHLYKLTNDMAYLERAEFCLYNSLYFNQYFTGDFGSHPIDHLSSVSNTMGAAWWCCTMHGLMAMRIIHDNYFVENNNGLAKLNLYLDTDYSDENLALSIKRGKQYNEYHSFDIQIDKAVNLKQPFLLRNPSWISDAEIYLNGKKIECKLKDNYYSVENKMNPGDKLQVRMKYITKLIRPDKSTLLLSAVDKPVTAALCTGPYVMAVDNNMDYTFLSEPSNNLIYSHTIADAAGNEALAKITGGSFVGDIYMTANYKHGGIPSYYQTVFRPLSEMTFHRHPFMMVSMKFVPESAANTKIADKAMAEPSIE